MLSGYENIVRVIIIEFSLVALIVLITYLLRIGYRIRDGYRDTKVTKLRSRLEKALQADQDSIAKFHIPHKYRLYTLLLLFEEFEKKYQKDEKWLLLKNRLIHHTLLPLARQQADSVDWVRRYFAAKMYTIANEDQDEQSIVDLINDKIPLVHLEANIAGLHHPTQAIMDAIINHLGSEERKSHAVYLKAFENIDSKSKEFVINRLSRETNPAMKSGCYELLLNYSETDNKVNTLEDIESSNTELQINSIKYFVRQQDKQAESKLLELLKNTKTKWQVKVAILHLLGELHQDDAIPHLQSLLNDENWWLSLNAASALFQIGEKGIQSLKTVSPQDGENAYKAAQYILKTH